MLNGAGVSECSKIRLPVDPSDGVSSGYDSIGYSRLGAVTAAIAEMIDGCWRVQVRLVARRSERDGVWQLESAPQLVPPLRFAA